MKKSLILIFLLGLVLPAYAVSVQEIQRVRLARAESFLQDGEDKKALRLIYANLKSKIPHIPTYLILARYYYDRSEISKSFKVYYSIIKRTHTPVIVSTGYSPNFEQLLNQVPRPSNDALKVYFEVAQKYWELYRDGRMDKEFREKVLIMSKKYFTVCQYYDYERVAVSTSLARIESIKSNPQQALKELKVANESNSKSLERSREKNQQEVELLMGETLLNEGRTDAGLLYLRSVYNSPSSSPALRQYAEGYLDALSKTYARVNFNYNINAETNMHKLTETQRSEFADSSLQDQYGVENGIVHENNIDLFLAKRWNNHWSTLFAGTLNIESASESTAKARDKRKVTLRADSKYENFDKAFIKLKYAYEMNWTRPTSESSLTHSTTTHSITPQYTYTLKSGLISYGLPIEMQSSTDQGSISQYGFEIGFRPFYRNRYFDFQATGEIGTKGEYLEESTSSTFFNLSGINQTLISDSWSLFSNLNYYSQSNQIESLSYSELSLSATFSYSFRAIKGLFGELGYSATQTGISNGENINNSSISGGLSYSF